MHPIQDPPRLAGWLRERDPDPITLTISLERSWLEPADLHTLTVHYERRGARVRATVGNTAFWLDEPLRLLPVAIPKPWGREVWYSGIEARGESRVVTSDRAQLALSSWLAAAPTALTGGAGILLLKVLDPRPEPVLGDLYFEVHEQKREVYVVTAVDRSVWPDGRGAVRFGMNQRKRAQFADDDAFRAGYLDAVQRYEHLRRALDAGETHPPGEESRARANMESFTALRALEVGDVVVVPTWLPHSLQHGVRVVEFQTPTYERYIISFAQKVLTQDHWDTAHAVANMSLDPPVDPAFATIAPGVERIASFPDFGVLRVSLEPGMPVPFPAGLPYAICCAIDAGVAVGDLELGAEEACIVPRGALTHAALSAGHTARCLVAAPGL
jgi:hypothetical protein